MLNFRNTTGLFFVLLIALIIYQLLHGLGFWVYLILLLLYSLVLFWGSYRVDSGFYLPVRCAGSPNQPEIAISFDDGPYATRTPAILDILKEAGVPAAFFCIGHHISGNEAILQRMVAEGHIIGNHSFSHSFWFDLNSSGRMTKDLAEMDQSCLNATGLRPKLFRPPYGVTNPALAKAVTRGGYIPIGWSIRSLDTVIRNEAKLLDRVTRSLHSGAIILFHDAGPATRQILPDFLRAVRERGFRIVRLDKLLNLDAYP
jgi:peptidoglycan/xylan/chitin deacetylase (PgdA/CDA1 family)